MNFSTISLRALYFSILRIFKWKPNWNQYFLWKTNTAHSLSEKYLVIFGNNLGCQRIQFIKFFVDLYQPSSHALYIPSRFLRGHSEEIELFTTFLETARENVEFKRASCSILDETWMNIDRLCQMISDRIREMFYGIWGFITWIHCHPFIGQVARQFSNEKCMKRGWHFVHSRKKCFGVSKPFWWLTNGLIHVKKSTEIISSEKCVLENVSKLGWINYLLRERIIFMTFCKNVQERKVDMMIDILLITYFWLFREYVLIPKLLTSFTFITVYHP